MVELSLVELGNISDKAVMGLLLVWSQGKTWDIVRNGWLGWLACIRVGQW